MLTLFLRKSNNLSYVRYFREFVKCIFINVPNYSGSRIKCSERRYLKLFSSNGYLICWARSFDLLVSLIPILDPTNFVYLFIKMERDGGLERNAFSIRFLWKTEYVKVDF